MINTPTFKIIIEEWQALQGFYVIAITKVNPEMADSDILKLANNQDAIIITKG